MDWVGCWALPELRSVHNVINNVKYNILTTIKSLDLLGVCFALVMCDSCDPAQRLRRFRWGSSGCGIGPSPRHIVS